MKNYRTINLALKMKVSSILGAHFKNFSLVLIFLSSFFNISFAQTNTCTGTIYDSGGAMGNYMNNENITETYCSDSGNEIKLTFTSFDIEENFDYLFIYDGADASAPLIGVYTNSSSPGAVVSSNGCLTIVFQSDASTNLAGYSADISCVESCDIVAGMTTSTSATCGNMDGTISAAASGMQGTIEYSIDAGLTYQASNVFNSLPAGTYQVFARYTDGTCVTFLSQEVIYSGCNEICDNGEDDDGDMNVDMADMDCDNTIVTCSALFTDDGGAMGNYSFDTMYVNTYCSANDAQIEATFTEFVLSQSSNVDTLLVFDGPDTLSPLIGKFYGTDAGFFNDEFRIKSYILSTNKCLTFQFKSIGFGINIGWQANISCTSPITQAGVEICGNGIDDDFDGLIDFQDADCPEALDQTTCDQGFNFYIPPVWKMTATETDYSSPAILCLSTDFPSANINLTTADGSYTRDIVITAGMPDTILFDDLNDILRTDVNNAVENNKGLIVSSDVPVQLLYILDGRLNKTLMTVKGKEAFGKSFRAGSQTNTLIQSALGMTREEHHFISVMATEDATSITINSDRPLEGQTLPATIMLDAGESYTVIDEGFNVTVSGALITSDKEIVVVSGSQHTSASGVTEDDGGLDMLVPVRSTGTEYVLMRGGVLDPQDYGIIVAIENNTDVFVNNVFRAKLNAGDFVQVDVTGPLGLGTYIETSKPSYAYQVSGLSLGEAGMAIVPAVGECRGDQFASFSRFNTTAEFGLNIIIEDTGLASLMFNGALYNTYATAITQAVPSLPGYSTVTIGDADIATINTVSSDEFFNAAVLIGDPIFAGTFGFITSFSEKVNILDPVLNDPVDFYVLDTICRSGSINHTLNTLSCGNTNKIRNIEQGTLGTAVITGDLSFQYTNNGDVGEDLISVTVINEFGIQSTVCLGIRIDSVYAAFNPADSTICSGETIMLELDSINGTPPYTYAWSTGEITPTIMVTPMADASFTVTVTDAEGCTGVDVFDVTLDMTITADAGPSVTICSGDFAQLNATQPVGTSGMWTGGAGFFDNDTIPNAIYTPDATETDSVILFWTLNGGSGGNCFDGTDSTIVYISPSLTLFAGDDTFICENAELNLADLNAQINSNTITTGTWSSSGDGVFMPGSTSMGMFPSSTTYIPGVNDIANGDFTLTLSAQDPGNTGPCSSGSDDVLISLNSTPVLVCNDNLNVSVNSDCVVELNVDMLIENPVEPLDFYTITLKDEFGNIIPGTTLNSAYINRTIEYSVGYECGANTCWGSITIEDKQIPDLLPDSYVVDCRDEVTPESVGFPLPINVSIFPNGSQAYVIEGFDGCSNVDLSYEDMVNDFECDQQYQTVIYRTWTATDASGNTTSAIDTISVERIALADVTLPLHYDDIDLPTLSCSATYPTTDEGYPAPEFTGIPDAGACAMIQATYTDVSFPMCGNTYKVLREWLIFDWCTSESIKYFQTIKITDQTPPVIFCPQNDIISTDDFSCNSGLYIIQTPETMDNCSEVSLDISVEGPDGEYIEVINGNVVADLPIGVSTITFVARDECDNASTCSYQVTTVDNVPPTPVCEGHTKVSLNNVGNARLYAASIDDGSHDNCEIESILIAKMPSQLFGDYVDFNCNELGSVIMVALQITDIYGNTNICMTEVELEDKIAPVISAPTDLTISCTTPIDETDLSNFGKVVLSPNDQEQIIIFDEENNGNAGIDGLAIDNCSVIVTEEVDIDIDCGVGEIRRTFTAIDGNNNELKAADVQIITVVNSSPFGANNIFFPPNVTVSGCKNLDTHPDETGQPTYTNEDCSSIVSSYEDKVFTVVDSACVLILREWKVLDMCQYNANTGTGIWTGTQSIKLNNLIAPEFTSSCADTTVCTYGECEGLVELSIVATDDCTEENELVYSYTIDMDDDGTIEYEGNSATISRTLDNGSYRVRWFVEDKCGNLETCNYLLTVEDCKNPTPYCLGGISTALMNNVGEVMITAESFDLGSFDNCTESDNLLFSFSENTNETTMTFNCDMLENGVSQTFELEMWVTDEAGNQDFCAILVTVQDNFDVCENTGSSTIGGAITNDEDEALTGATIQLSSDFEGGNQTFVTEEDGLYAFQSLPSGISYNVTPNKNDDMLNGVTTLDIVLIQKHILGLEVFDQPQQYIAADVNHNEGITGIDIVQIRKAILGYYDEYPDNTSWRFVDKNYDFSNENYYEFEEYISINPLTDDVADADFTAIKIGDVNMTASPNNFSAENIDNRSGESFVLNIRKLNEETIEVYSENEGLISGMQFELVWEPSAVAEIIPGALHIQDYQTRMLDKGFKLAYHNDQSVDTRDEVLFTLRYSGDVNLDDIIESMRLNPVKIKPEMYTDQLMIQDVELETRENTKNGLELYLYQNTPNPFNGSTVVGFDMPDNDNITLQVIDANGKIVVNTIAFAQKGYNQLIIDQHQLNAAGIYYYQLNTSYGVITKKMILLE